MAVIREAPHECQLPGQQQYRPGTIWECDDCGQQYKLVDKYHKSYRSYEWKALWFARKPQQVKNHKAEEFDD